MAAGYLREVQIPGIDLDVHRPTRSSVAWYGTMGALAAAGVLEWPLAAVIGVSHLIATNSKSPGVEEAADALESGV